MPLLPTLVVGRLTPELTTELHWKCSASPSAPRKLTVICAPQGVSPNVSFYIENNQRTKNNVIICEWKWWVKLAFAIENIRCFYLVWTEPSEAPGGVRWLWSFHWLLWQLLQAQWNCWDTFMHLIAYIGHCIRSMGPTHLFFMWTVRLASHGVTFTQL